MKKLRQLLLFLLMCNLDNVVLCQDWIVIPGNSNDIILLNNYAQNASADFELSPLFSAIEKQSLNTWQLPLLAEAQLVHSSWNAEKIIQYWQGMSPTLKIEPNLTLELQNTPLAHPEQWGLKNSGQELIYRTSQIDGIKTVGIPGQDIGLSELPPEAVSSTTPAKVAIIDSGIDWEHPALKENIAFKKGECLALQQYRICLRENSASPAACHRKYALWDEDQNGYPLDCAGWNVFGTVNPLTGIRGSLETQDEAGHGTHVAGIIGARPLLLGIRGVTQNVQLLPIKIAETKRKFLTSAAPAVGPSRSDTNAGLITDKQLGPVKTFGDLLARALVYALQEKVNIINISLGWPRQQDSVLLRSLIELAHKKNISVVVAAGNDANAFPIFPCTYEGVICVGAHGSDGQLTPFSNFGSSVDLAAPGQQILSTWPLSLKPVFFNEMLGFDFMDGSSMAAPFVAGALARLLNAGFLPHEAEARLLLGAKKIPTKDNDSGDSSSDVLRQRFALQHGLLNLAESFKVLPQALIKPFSKQNAFIYWRTGKAGEKSNFTFKLKNYWRGAQKVQISLEPLKASVAGTTEAEIALLQTSWFEAKWIEREVREFTVPLEITRQNLATEQNFILTLKVDEQAAQQFALRAEVILRPDFNDLETQKNLQLKKYGLNQLFDYQYGDEIRTLQINFPNSATQQQPRAEYYSVRRQAARWQIRILSPQEKEYKISSILDVPISRGEMIQFTQMDINHDGNADYVAVFYEPVKGAGSSIPVEIHLMAWDRNFQPLALSMLGQESAHIIYSNKPVAMGNEFKWLWQGNNLVPCWISMGVDPQEKKQPDLWQPKPKPELALRLYCWGRDSLVSFNAPTGYQIFSFVQEQTQTGGLEKIPLLLFKGKDIAANYFVTQFSVGAKWENIQALNFKNFQSLLVSEYVPSLVLNQKSSQDILRTWMVRRGLNGFKLSTLARDSAGAELQTAQSSYNGIPGAATLSKPITAFFSQELKGNQQTDLSFFWLSNFEIHFWNQATQQEARTSLKKFSFMPGFFFEKFWAPLTVAQKENALYNRPALLLNAGLGLHESSELVLPVWEASGKMILQRPARYRVQPPANCEALNPRPKKATQEAAMVFFCGDQFVEVPIVF